MTFNPANSLGPFLPINQTFSEDDDQFLIQITNRDRDIARNINVREIALYDLAELPTGEQWFNLNNTQVKRNGYRKVFSINSSTTTIAHGITGITLCTHIYGAATDGTNFFPLPYVDVTNVTNQIGITVNATTISINKGGGAPPAITNGTIVLEYLKN